MVGTGTRRLWPRIAALAIVGIACWAAVCRIEGVPEPWDADRYWRIWYPVSLIPCAIGGPLLHPRAWLAGVIVTAAQLPVMFANSTLSPFLLVGLMFLTVLAIPAATVAEVAQRLVVRGR